MAVLVLAALGFGGEQAQEGREVAGDVGLPRGLEGRNGAGQLSHVARETAQELHQSQVTSHKARVASGRRGCTEGEHLQGGQGHLRSARLSSAQLGSAPFPPE